jgi:hypothetical protein
MTDTESAPAPKPKGSWRSGDVSLPVLAAVYVVASVAVLGLAASGSWIGVVGAAVIVAAEIALVIVWANAPFDHDTTTENPTHDWSRESERSG